MLKWEDKIPSNDSNSKLPILDLKVWIDPESKKVKHTFYKKPMARPSLIEARSAIPIQMKINILTEEGWRRIRNCSESMESKQYFDRRRKEDDNLTKEEDNLTEEDFCNNAEVLDILKEFNVQMKIDGHTEKNLEHRLRGRL